MDGRVWEPPVLAEKAEVIPMACMKEKLTWR